MEQPCLKRSSDAAVTVASIFFFTAFIALAGAIIQTSVLKQKLSSPPFIFCLAVTWIVALILIFWWKSKSRKITEVYRDHIVVTDASQRTKRYERKEVYVNRIRPTTRSGNRHNSYQFRLRHSHRYLSVILAEDNNDEKRIELLLKDCAYRFDNWVD